MKALPREVLRDVRQTINEFRADQWDGLVRMRNQLWEAMGYTALIIFGMLALAVLANVSKEVVVATCAFYLVGAVVGLFSRLYTQSQQENAVDDKGLATARLFLVPMLSGIAGVGGVLVTAMLSGAMLTSGVFTPPSGAPTATPSGTPVMTSAVGAAAFQTVSPLSVLVTGAVASLPAGSIAPTHRGTAQRAQQTARLEDIFNLEKNPVGLTIAAVFGVAPGQLLRGLQQQSDQYKISLKKSQASQRGES